MDNAAATIVVVASDKGEPGTADTFKVTTSTGYSATGAPIARGNLQLHTPGNCESSGTGGGKPRK